MALVRIKLIDTRDGIGKAGDLMDVSPERAERWAHNGIAALVEEKKAEVKPKVEAKAKPKGK